MTTIYFVRHGEYKNPDNIVPWRLAGFPLSEKGRKDITANAKYFLSENTEFIYSSPVLRCRQSARIVGKILNKKIIITNSLAELYSPLQFKKIRQEYAIRQKDYPYKNQFHMANGGETVEKIFSRVDKLVTKILKIHENNKVILVSHGDPIMIFTLGISGRLREFFKFNDVEKNNYIPKAGIIKAEYKESKFIKLKSINY